MNNERSLMESAMPNKAVKSCLIVLLLAAGFAVSACNTVEGFGKDLSTLGNKITGKAEKHTDK